MEGSFTLSNKDCFSKEFGAYAPPYRVDFESPTKNKKARADKRRLWLIVNSEGSEIGYISNSSLTCATQAATRSSVNSGC